MGEEGAGERMIIEHGSSSAFYIRVFLLRVPQPWHYGHLGPRNSLLWGLFRVLYLAASLASAHLMPLASPRPTRSDTPECLQTLLMLPGHEREPLINTYVHIIYIACYTLQMHLIFTIVL